MIPWFGIEDNDTNGRGAERGLRYSQEVFVGFVQIIVIAASDGSTEAGRALGNASRREFLFALNSAMESEGRAAALRRARSSAG